GWRVGSAAVSAAGVGRTPRHALEDALRSRLDEPPSQGTVIRVDPMAHPLDDLLGGASAAADVAHHFLVAVEGDEGGLVGGPEAAETETNGLGHCSGSDEG